MSEGRKNHAALTAAVVGTGWGCLTHVPALRAAGIEVRTLVGTNEERTRSRTEISEVPGWSVDLDKVLADPDLDIVVVATPPQTHVDIVLAAVAAGKHVVCEKPFATTVEDAIKMRDSARTARVVHAVGHEFRWQPHTAACAQAVRRGAIGDPTMITHVRINGILAGESATAPDWFESPADFGGWPNAEAQHVIDEIRTAVGEFSTVTALEGQVTHHHWDAAETFLVQFVMDGGAMGVIQSSIGAFGSMTITQRICGTKGSIWTSSDGLVTVADSSGERIVEPPAHLVGGSGPSQPSKAKPLAGGDTLSTALAGATSRFARPTQLLHETVRDRILGRTSPSWPPLPTFDDGLANTAVHLAIRRSIETGLPQQVNDMLRH